MNKISYLARLGATSVLLYCHQHHDITFAELGHLLTRSGLTHPEVSSKVYHDSFCQLGSSVSLPWVIYFEAFNLHVLSSFSCIPVICPKLVLFLTPLQFVNLFYFEQKRLNTIWLFTVAWTDTPEASQELWYGSTRQYQIKQTTINSGTREL